MILRFAAALSALAAIVTPAWADGGGPVDPTSASAWVSLLRDNGPWGLLFFVGWLAWTQKGEIRELNKALVAATGKAEAVSGAVTNALASLEAASKVSDDRNSERWESVKGMSADLVRVATLVAANAGAIESLRNAIPGIPSNQAPHGRAH